MPRIGGVVTSLEQSGGGSLGLRDGETAAVLNRVVTAINAAWTAYTPTLAYTGTGPATAALTGASYYQQIGSLCFFNVYLYAASVSSGNATAMTLSLPLAPKQKLAHTPIYGIQLVHTNYYNPQAYIDQMTTTEAQNLVRLRAFTTLGTNPFSMQLHGFYEVAGGA